MSDVLIRKAEKKDVPTIREIYAPYVANTAITFETEIPTIDEIYKRLETNSRYGWNVAVASGDVVGFAYGSKHRERAAYQWCCEVSIYLRENFQGKGVGSLLYTKLFDELKTKGLIQAYGGITLPNEQSVGFHESMGFSHLGTYKNVGYKLEKWHDVGWWEKKLGDCSKNPSPPNFGPLSNR